MGSDNFRLKDSSSRIAEFKKDRGGGPTRRYMLSCVLRGVRIIQQTAAFKLDREEQSKLGACFPIQSLLVSSETTICCHSTLILHFTIGSLEVKSLLLASSLLPLRVRITTANLNIFSHIRTHLSVILDNILTAQIFPCFDIPYVDLSLSSAH